MDGGMFAVSRGSCALIWSTVLDDVGTGLLEDDQQDAAIVVLIGRDRPVGGFQDRMTDVAYAQRRAVAIGEHDVVIELRDHQLIVGGDDEALGRKIDRSLGRVARGIDQGVAHLFQRDPGRREPTGVDLHADRRLGIAADDDLRHAGHLRHLLGEEVVGVVVDRGERQRIGMHRENEDRRIRRIDLAVGRRVVKRLRQRLAVGGDRGLHVLRGGIDVPVEIELDDDRRRADRRLRRHLP